MAEQAGAATFNSSMRDRDSSPDSALKASMRRVLPVLEDHPGQPEEDEDSTTRLPSTWSDDSFGRAPSRTPSQLSVGSIGSNRSRSFRKVASTGSNVSNASSLWGKVREKLREGRLTTHSMTLLEGLRQSEFEDRRGKKANGVEEICMQAIQDMVTASEMLEAADDHLEESVEIAEDKGGVHGRATACAYIAELLNRWAATRGAYSRDIMERAALYSLRAVEAFDELEEARAEVRAERRQAGEEHRAAEHAEHAEHAEQGVKEEGGAEKEEEEAKQKQKQKQAQAQAQKQEQEQAQEEAGESAAAAVPVPAGGMEKAEELDDGGGSLVSRVREREPGAFDGTDLMRVGSLRERWSEAERLQHELMSALYWQALNFATLAGVQNSVWSIPEASEMFHQSIQRLEVVDFARGVHSFNIAKSRPGRNFKNKVINVPLSQQLHQLTEAKQLFMKAYDIWEEVYSDEHSRTVTAITMALHWAQKDLRAREKLHSRHHPRTKQARQVYHALIKQMSGGSPSARGPVSPRSGKRMSLSPDNRYSVLVPDQVDISELTWDLKLYYPKDGTDGWKSPEWMVGALVTMFNEAGVTAELAIEEAELVNFFSMVRGLYWEHNDFHNFTHVFSVTHASYLLAVASSARGYLTIEDQIAILLAGLCHDLDHHGVNSDFLIKTASPLAARYPRATLLEEHHLTETLRVLEATGLLRNLSDLSRAIVLDQLGSAVMATYMGTHAEIVELLKSKAEAMERDKVGGHRRPPFDATSTLDRKQLVETITHAADLSGQCMEKHYALASGKMIMMEFHRQHLREVAEELPITPFMAGLHTPLDQARCQLGFLVYVVVPLWRAMAEVFPELLQCYKNVEQRVVEIDFDNLDQWAGVNWDIMKTREPMQNQREAPATRSRSSALRRGDSLCDKPTSSYD